MVARLLRILCLALLALQLASLGVHQGQHAFDGALGALPAHAQLSAPAPDAAPALGHAPGEICGLCQLQRTMVSQVFHAPAVSFFIPSCERLDACSPTGPPSRVVSDRFRARAPPA
jgi:hypothetical protein